MKHVLPPIPTPSAPLSWSQFGDVYYLNPFAGNWIVSLIDFFGLGDASPVRIYRDPIFEVWIREELKGNVYEETGRYATRANAQNCVNNLSP